MRMLGAQQMTNYFVIRTADDEKEWIWQEIQQGRLRQGWGLSNTELPAGEHTPDGMGASVIADRESKSGKRKSHKNKLNHATGYSGQWLQSRLATGS
jgi:hypothetical protein